MHAWHVQMKTNVLQRDSDSALAPLSKFGLDFSPGAHIIDNYIYLLPTPQNMKVFILFKK